MGSKRRLLPWIHQILASLDFQSGWDPFCGTSSVAYLIKAMGKRVIASGFLNFPAIIARATVENSGYRLSKESVLRLLSECPDRTDFIERTFKGVFFRPADLAFLDNVSGNIVALDNQYEQAIAYAALFRSCIKRQPRGVFTISGDLARYDDGRRDLRLSLKEHFLEQVEVFNSVVFDNGCPNLAMHGDVFELSQCDLDLVYLDPPYVPRSDDNCYIKRYHFLEGLSCYWRDTPVNMATKVRKISKRRTPFSYRHTAVDAFDRLFARFQRSIIVLSYSSNGFPDLPELEKLLRRYKKRVDVFHKLHRYHFGTHEKVRRSTVTEYLLVGQ